MKKNIIIIIVSILIIIFGVIYSYNKSLFIFTEDKTLLKEEVMHSCIDSKDISECLAKKAIENKDSDICDLDEESKDYCYGRYAFELNSFTECDLISKSDYTSSSDSCYFNAALKTSDVKYCFKLNDKFSAYRKCFGHFAVILKDKSLCEYTGRYKEDCLKTVELGSTVDENGYIITDYRN